VTTSPLDAEGLHDRVQKALDAFMARQVLRLDAVGEDLAPLSEAASSLLGGGKRLRPAFCYWGWRGAGGEDCEEIVHAAAALELLHACALIHDDVMDDSATRRGQASAHLRFAALHQDSGWLGSSTAFGTGAAILLGDLCLSWADEMLFGSGVDGAALLAAKPVYDEMRTELMAGQYLDLLEQSTGTGSVAGAHRVLRFKSAKYTVERPLHLGASLAAGDDSLLDTFSAFGLPLGEAFQLRDDVLGVFGDPAETGKPAGDDLREGKRTVLVNTALASAAPAERAQLQSRLGDPHLDAAGVDELRGLIRSSGALDHVEGLIASLTLEALAALDRPGVADPARQVLAQLAVAATERRG
jgi:geranylgeranyl diphosphate synthase, type I